MTIKPRLPAPPLSLTDGTIRQFGAVRPDTFDLIATGRSSFDQALRGIDLAIERKSPARGEA